MQPDLLSLFGLWRASSDAIGRGCSFLLCIAGGTTMARRKSKKKSHKLLKTAILLVLFIGVWFIYNHTDIPARIQNALRPHKASTVRTVPEPEVTPPKPQTGVLPPPAAPLGRFNQTPVGKNKNARRGFSGYPLASDTTALFEVKTAQVSRNRPPWGEKTRPCFIFPTPLF